MVVGCAVALPLRLREGSSGTGTVSPRGDCRKEGDAVMYEGILGPSKADPVNREDLALLLLFNA